MNFDCVRDLLRQRLLLEEPGKLVLFELLEPGVFDQLRGGWALRWILREALLQEVSQLRRDYIRYGHGLSHVPNHRTELVQVVVRWRAFEQLVDGASNGPYITS